MKFVKIICLALVLILCAGAMASCKDNTDDIPEGYQLISGSNVPYRFYAPTQWLPNSGDKHNGARYSNEDSSMVVITLYTPDKDYESIDEFWLYVEEQYKATYSDYIFLGDEESKLGGKDAKSFTFTAKIGDIGKFKVMQVITAHGNFCYAMTYTSTPENFDLHLLEVQGMMDVFEIK